MIISGLGTWPGADVVGIWSSPLYWNRDGIYKLEASGDTLAERHKFTSQVRRYRDVLCGTEPKNVTMKCNLSRSRPAFCRHGITSLGSPFGCRIPCADVCCCRWPC